MSFNRWIYQLIISQQKFSKGEIPPLVYSEQITKQLEGKEIDTVEIQPIDLSLQVLKEVGAKWLVEMADYISDNPQFIVNGFIRSGITDALDGTYNSSNLKASLWEI